FICISKSYARHGRHGRAHFQRRAQRHHSPVHRRRRPRQPAPTGADGGGARRRFHLRGHPLAAAAALAGPPVVAGGRHAPVPPPLGVRGDMYEWITGVLKARGGTFTFCGPWFTNLHCVVTADPRNLEHLLKTKFGNFPKGPYFRDTVRDLLGDGIFGADDEVWRQQRKAASLEFHSAEFRALTASSLVELVHRRLLPVLAETEAAGAAVDLQDVLLRLTFDNVCMIAFGADPGCLQKGLPEIPFARAFEDATEATIVRFVTPTAVWRGMRALGVGHERVLRRSLAGVDEFAYDVIRKRREELAAAAATGHEEAAGGLRRADLLTIFTKMRGADGAPAYSDKFLRDICVNFILAGRDTSSVALAWFFWLLSKNRGVEAKILQEVEGIVAARGRCGEVEEELVFQPEEVKRMEYLHAALSEALRLYPSVPVDHKEVRATYFVSCSYNTYMHAHTHDAIHAWHDCLMLRPCIRRWCLVELT
uniref:Cytochrome P450 n=1 Tax=Aegilops tauschii subsp. strangulata TaxID=200361 RepID=A0A452YH13_AEGTS